MILKDGCRRMTQVHKGLGTRLDISVNVVDCHSNGTSELYLPVSAPATSSLPHWLWPWLCDLIW